MSAQALKIQDNILVSVDNTLIYKGAHVIIPKSVTSIDVFAFTGCTNLTTITLPKGVKSIGDSAFHNCQLIA